MHVTQCVKKKFINCSQLEGVMNFLANENFPLDAVAVLRQAGHDVVWIRTASPGITDEAVLARAIAKIGCCSLLTKILVNWQFGVACRQLVVPFSSHHSYGWP